MLGTRTKAKRHGRVQYRSAWATGGHARVGTVIMDGISAQLLCKQKNESAVKLNNY